MVCPGRASLFLLLCATLACTPTANGPTSANDLNTDLTLAAYREPDTRIEKVLAAEGPAAALRPALEALLAAPGAERPWQRLSDLYSLLRDDAGAEALFAKLGERFPASPYAPRFEGFHQFRQGSWDVALEAYTRAAALAPRDPEPPFRRGLILQSLGRFEAARISLEDSVRLAPDNPTVLARYIRILRISGNEDRAATEALHAVKRFPADAKILQAKAELDLRAGELEAAESGLRKALARDPNLIDAWADLARLLHRLDRTDEAEEAQRHVRELTEARDASQSSSQ